ncbi:hypothetical protein QBC38DRAFT_467456 [Podospora fimiseda]|uniref:Uncharacterized protein n=1 Tax=Podospora fimiseda TaxID=252190 RepID=A0AAN7BWK6_9PEZI|nr:hypothetical protein QBC38DRAFT_467456 [Podospora fimiseda]
MWEGLLVLFLYPFFDQADQGKKMQHCRRCQGTTYPDSRLAQLERGLQISLGTATVVWYMGWMLRRRGTCGWGDFFCRRGENVGWGCVKQVKGV